MTTFAVSKVALDGPTAYEREVHDMDRMNEPESR
jgi:hypothetical protein